jgi:antibiotic biosynthesis monooxygenase (ABM) superfamily enzyme
MTNPPNNTASHKPNRARFAALIFCFIYPLVTFLLYALIPLTQGWSIWQRNLIMVPIIVIVMVYVVIPFIQKRLKRWL